MSELYDVDRTRITSHINNIINDNELEFKSNVRKTHFPNSDKPVNVYNLDMILAVGYRVNSKRGILFRRWANSILKQYLMKDYVINESRCITHSDNLIKINHNLNVIRTNSYHDRFIIIDDELYNIGSSIKDIGKKISHISKLENINIDDLLKIN